MAGKRKAMEELRKPDRTGECCRAFFHLPGLFEFYDLYQVFLPLFRRHRDYFYNWCEIGSIYGAPADCLWGGGRVGGGERAPEEVLALTQFSQLEDELRRDDFRFVVPDFRLNKAFGRLRSLQPHLKDKVEFLCNECCWFGCTDRKRCYEAVSRRNLSSTAPEFCCKSPGADEGYRFSKAMENPGFISVDDIRNRYMPMGFSNFKIEGRGLGSALVLEFLLYYLTKPEYQIHVREHVYLDNMLDLF